VSHFKLVCKVCGKVIAQCRCMDCNKEVKKGVCDDCKAEPVTKLEEDWRKRHNLSHEWHCKLNKFNDIKKSKFEHWMYEAKRIWEALPSMIKSFELESTGKLTKEYKHCSMSPAIPLKDNKLNCCLGKVCRDCDYLKALSGLENENEAKAYTCISHILHNIEKCDTSEGYLLTDDDKMFWQNTYKSLADTQDKLED
jgi:hypothetical protein